MKNHHIWIEGSSCTYGYHDESGKGGFAGRIAQHFQEYSAEGKKRNWGGVNEWVYVHNFAIPGRLLPMWTPLLGNHAAEILQSSSNKECSMIGMFVLEAHPLSAQNLYGARLFDRWRASMEHIQEESTHLDASIVLQMPIPERQLGERGRDIFDQLTQIALKGTTSIDTARFVEVGKIPGFDTASHLAEDRMHPSAAGHQFLANRLIPMLHDLLALEPRNELANAMAGSIRL